MRVAKAELDCETMIGLMHRDDPLAGHNVYTAKVAASGCDTKIEFVVSCSGQSKGALFHRYVPRIRLACCWRSDLEGPEACEPFAFFRGRAPAWPRLAPLGLAARVFAQ